MAHNPSTRWNIGQTCRRQRAGGFGIDSRIQFLERQTGGGIDRAQRLRLLRVGQQVLPQRAPEDLYFRVLLLVTEDGE